MKRTIAIALILGAFLSSIGAQETFLRTSGTLSQSDARSETGGFSDRYEVDVPPGTLVAVLAAAVDFEPQLTIDVGAGPQSEFEAAMGSAYATAFLARRGPVEVVVIGPEGARGDYMLRVYEIPTAGSVRAGDSLDGALQETDQQRSQQRYVDWYDLSLRAGESVSILAEADFDSYLIVQYPDGRVVENDDTTDTHAGAMITATESEDYLIGVSSLYGDNTTGGYTLSVKSVAPPEAMSIGEVVMGRLEAGEQSDRFVVEGAEKQVVLISVDSSDFDTFLSVEDRSGAVYENDDAMSGGTDSEITYTFMGTNTAEISVRAFANDGIGEYRLSIVDVSDRYEVTEVIDGQRLEDGESIFAFLGGAAGNGSGRVGQRFTFEPRADQRVTVTLESESFDTYLEVRTPSDELLSDDDGADFGSNSQLEFVAGDAGVYDVFATSYSGTAQGFYTIRVDLGPIVDVLRRESGDLSGGDETDSAGRYYDDYKVRLTADQTVSISVASLEFDTYLYVYGPDGEVVGENDDAGMGSDSAVELESPADGSYTVRVTSYSSGYEGAYDLIVSEWSR